MLSILALLVFPALAVYAAISDLLTMRIANWLTLVLLAAYLVLALVAGVPLSDICMGLAAAGIVLVAAFSFFALGWIGGGDAKLISAMALWMGFGLLLQYVIYSALLGGALTMIVLGLRQNAVAPWLTRFAWIEWLHNRKAGVPYGVALAAAGLLLYPQTAIFRFFVAS